MNSWSNQPNGRKYAIYDDRFGYRYFDTKKERDDTFENSPWIDQKHWTIRD